MPAKLGLTWAELESGTGSRLIGIRPGCTAGRLAVGRPGQAAWTQVQLGQAGGQGAPSGSSSPAQRSVQPASSRPVSVETSVPAPEICITSSSEDSRSTTLIQRPTCRKPQSLEALARAAWLTETLSTATTLKENRSGVKPRYRRLCSNYEDESKT